MLDYIAYVWTKKSLMKQNSISSNDKTGNATQRSLFYFCSNSPMYLYVVVRLKSHTRASSLTFNCPAL